VTQQMEAGASVHLPLGHLGLVAGSFGPAVVMRQRERCSDCLDVQVQAPGEGVQVRQVSFAGAGDLSLEPGLVFRGWGEHLGEGADQNRQGGHLRAGAVEAGERFLLAGREAVGLGEQDAGCAAG
jgi:hypothetical protein